MAYADLTNEEKADLATYHSTVAPLLHSFSKLMKEIDPESLDTWITTKIDPILAQLLAADEVPNTTSYAGISDLERQELVAINSILTTLRLLRTDNRVELVKLIGINA